MQLSFERGDATRPRGHALVFFREALDPSRVRATYVVIAPIEMDLAKYVPPMLAGQLTGLVPSGPTAVPLPPIPEAVESLDWLKRLAEARDDDLLDGGSIDAANPQQMIFRTSELAGEYAALWSERAARLTSEPPPQEPAALPDVEDLLLSVMSDSEKVGRLARLAGTLRYAAEGGDRRLLEDTLAQMRRIGGLLPETYRVDDLLAAAQRPGQAGSRLLQLFIERCYKLAAEDYEALTPLDREIAQLSGA